MKTFWVPLGQGKLPLIQAEDGSFHVPMRPICARLDICWKGMFETIFRRPNIFRVNEHRVEDEGEFTQMTTIPLLRLGWWMKTTLGRPLKAEDEWLVGATIICDEILAAFDGFIAVQFVASDPNQQYALRDKDLTIADLQRRLVEAGKGRGKNRMPRALRVKITEAQKQEWRAMYQAGKSFAEIGDLVGRHQGTVRRTVLSMEGISHA